MSAVWVVRNREGEVMRVVLREFDAVATVGEFGGTVTRETLLTPAQAAVIEAAKAWAEAAWENGPADLLLLGAVQALRALEEDT
jgi:hypothetical protein